MKHIIIIGFKHAGKSVTGKLLARKIDRPFFDLDDLVERLHFEKSGRRESCRGIMAKMGKDYFHKLEIQALEEILHVKKPAVIAVGGGTPIYLEARNLIKRHTIVLISAPKDVIFKRIMHKGIPAFFPKKGNPRQAFDVIFRKRMPVLEALANIKVSNTGSVHHSVSGIIRSLKVMAKSTPKTILLIHGPNLNLLGARDAGHYGSLTLKQLENKIKAEAAQSNLKLKSFQSNHEGALIDYIQKNRSGAKGIIINPGAFTHYSYALYDALVDAGLPTIEVHLSDVKNRESWRRKSVIAPACDKVISGEKEKGYSKAIKALEEILNE